MYFRSIGIVLLVDLMLFWLILVGIGEDGYFGFGK